MNVFLDDEREPPSGFTLVKTVQECIALLRSEEVEMLSLDHDLGTEETGLTVVDFMCEHGIFPQAIYLHTQNPVGRQRMYATLRRYVPDTTHLHFTSYKGK